MLTNPEWGYLITQARKTEKTYVLKNLKLQILSENFLNSQS